jgi:hypothetical protein
MKIAEVVKIVGGQAAAVVKIVVQGHAAADHAAGCTTIFTTSSPW